MISNVTAQLESYKGLLGWTALFPYPALEIEMFIKDHPIPIRKPKFTEMSLVSQIDHISGKETGFKGIFFGAPDPLQIQFQGWIITPKVTVTNRWDVPSIFGNVPYVEIISNFLMGLYNPTIGGAYRRRDPDYYITPYGHRYENPTIAVWDPQFTVNMRKQQFSMTLYLEN